MADVVRGDEKILILLWKLLHITVRILSNIPFSLFTSCCCVTYGRATSSKVPVPVINMALRCHHLSITTSCSDGEWPFHQQMTLSCRKSRGTALTHVADPRLGGSFACGRLTRDEISHLSTNARHLVRNSILAFYISTVGHYISCLLEMQTIKAVSTHFSSCLSSCSEIITAMLPFIAIMKLCAPLH